MKYCFIIVRSLQREENRHFCDSRAHIKLMDLQCILFLPIFVHNLAILVSQSWQPCIMHITVCAVRIAAWTQTYLLTLWSAFCDLMKQFRENFCSSLAKDPHFPLNSFICRSCWIQHRLLAETGYFGSWSSFNCLYVCRLLLNKLHVHESLFLVTWCLKLATI